MEIAYYLKSVSLSILKCFRKNAAEKAKTEVSASFVTRGTGNIFIKSQEPFLKIASTIAGHNSHRFLLSISPVGEVKSKEIA